MLFFKKQISVNEAINRSRTEKDAVLVDVRPIADFKKNHVKGSVNVPLERFDLLKNRIPNKEAHLYIIGSYYSDPKKAKRPLKKAGYNNVTLGGFFEDHHVTPLG